MERDMKIQVGCVKVILTFSFVHLVDLPHSIHQPVSAFPAFPPSSGLQGPWSKPQGMLPDMLVSLVLHLTVLMPAQTPYPHIAQLLISCGICGIHMAVVLWKNLLWEGWL